MNLVGLLQITEHKGRKWGVLSVPNALVRGVYSAMKEPGISLPLNKAGDLNAHITVFRPEEIDQLGGPDTLKADRGKQFTYTIGRLESVSITSMSDVTKAWMLRIHSPELQKLRRTYGLSSRPKDDKFDFHITVALRRKGVLMTNQISKLAEASELDKEVMAFALNLEHMEVAYYSGLGNVPFGSRPLDRKVKEFLQEVLDNEKSHAAFLAKQLGDSAPEAPKIDIKGAFNAVGDLAGLGDFDPYESLTNFLLGGMFIEDVGVTGYTGASAVVEDTDVRHAVGGILSCEAHHMGMVRSFLYLLDQGGKVAEITEALATVKNEAGDTDFDQPIKLDGAANFVPTDEDGIGFARTPVQVLQMVTMKKAARPDVGGGLFPEGLNGDFSLLFED
jgi:rubrerythrin